MEVVSGGMIWWSLFVVLGVSGGFWFFRLIMMGKTRREKLPPGSMGWPLLGETLQLIKAYKTSDPEPFVDYRRSQYGSVFKTHLFGKPTIFSIDAEVNRFILQNEGKIFVTNYPSSIGNLLGKNSLLLMTGGLHKKLHSMTLNFASSHSQRDVLMFHIERIVCLTLESWDSRVLLQEEAKKITFELTLKQLLSIDPGEWSENLREKYLKLIDGFFCIPVALPFTTYRNALKARSKVAEELRLVVRKRREEYEGGEEDYDMLGTLMKDSETCLSEDQIVDFLLSLLVAGYETTSTIMTLSVKFLTETPKALAQLKEEHEEIRMQKNENQKLEWSDYKSMAFTQCVINETLRMANIIAGVFRKSLTDTEVKGYIIPEGWLVFPCFRGVHLDNELYEDARTFNPWRWQKGNNAPVSFGPTFTPFGGGPRLCPGYELARVEISVFLHHLVTLFSWKVAEEDKLIFFPTTRTVKKYPIQLVRSGRRPPPEY